MTQEVMLGFIDIAITGRMENMGLARYLQHEARRGYRMGPGVVVGAMLEDGLKDAFPASIRFGVPRIWRPNIRSTAPRRIAGRSVRRRASPSPRRPASSRSGSSRSSCQVARGRPAAVTLILCGDVDIREAHPALNDSDPIARMIVQEGAALKCGDLIATLDDSRHATSLAQAKAQMQNAKETLAKLIAGSGAEEISQAKATMDALKATFRNNEANYRRSGALVVTNAGTIKNRYDAKVAFDAVRQTWILAVKGPRKENIAAARAAYRLAEAAVAQAQRDFGDTRLYAPSDGVVEDRIPEPGDMASLSAPGLHDRAAEPVLGARLRAGKRPGSRPARHGGRDQRR